MLEKFRSYAQTKAAKIILALILVPFALFGIDSYLNQAGNNLSIAKVNGYKIALPEYNRAIENVRNRIMSEGKKVDPAMFDSFEFKESVIDGLITKQLLNNDIKKSRFRITDQQLSQYIIGMPEFQKDGKFSQEIYDKVLQNNQLTPKKFEESIRNDLLIQQVRDGLQKLTFIPPNSFALARTVEYFKIPRNVLTICVGKSTYARCGIIVNVTPFEPEWEGYVTLEFSNTTPLPAKIYAGEGCAQVLFFESDEVCGTSYKDRGGKYQGQHGVTLPKT